MIGICTDSGAQLPEALISRFGIEVVALTVTVDGVDYLEHTELTADEFYARFGHGHRPEVATAAPSPGRFAAAYDALAQRGATDILSIHIGADLSGTLNAARVAAGAASVPVRLVDTGAASFVVAGAVWSAADAADAGATVDRAADAALSTARACGNIFVVDGLRMARAGGRLGDQVTDDQVTDDVDATVLRLADGKLDTVGHARSADEAAETMAVDIRSAAGRLRVGVGHSDESSRRVADRLAELLADATNVAEIIRYRVGPSVGAHTGPGTAGAVFWPAP